MAEFHFDRVNAGDGLQPIAAFQCGPDHDLGLHWPVVDAAEDADFFFAPVAVPDSKADVVVGLGGGEEVYSEDPAPRSRVSPKLGIRVRRGGRGYVEFDFHAAVSGAADFAVAGF